MNCHNCGRSMRAPSLSVTDERGTANYGPRCAAKIQPPAPRARAHLPKVAALFRKPRATQAEVDPRQMVLDGVGVTV